MESVVKIIIELLQIRINWYKAGKIHHVNISERCQRHTANRDIGCFAGHDIRVMVSSMAAQSHYVGPFQYHETDRTNPCTAPHGFTPSF